MAEPLWPDPVNWADFQVAIKSLPLGETKVIKSQGKEYKITRRDKDEFWIQATTGLVPCGKFARKSIEDALTKL